jgi:hypothetical protein
MTKRKQQAIENLTQWTVGAILGALCFLTFMLMQYIIYDVHWKFFWQL